MRVKILIGITGKGFVYQAGGVYTLPPGEAEEYIRLGRAVEVKEEPKAKPVRVQKVKAETRPVRKKTT
jgi:hypothetical protein